MSVLANISEMLRRDPFEPFRVITSSGESYVVRNPDLVALMKSEVFIAQPNSDRHTFVPMLHVAAIEKLGGTNGNGRSSRERKRRR